MKEASLAVSLLLAAAILTSCVSMPTVGWGTYSTSLDNVAGKEWRTDLDSLAARLLARHPNPFHEGRKAEFDSLFSALAAEIENAPAGSALADQAVTGIARLLATIGEGHTSINASPSSYYPFVTRWFGSGAARELRVVEVQDGLQGLRDALGSKVVEVSGRPLAEVLPFLDATLAVDHPNGYQVGEVSVLMNPRLMRGLGLADDSGITFMLLRDGGATLTVTVPEVTASELRMVDIWKQSKVDRALSYQRLGEPRWREVVGTTMYIAYNTCDTEALGFFQDIVKELRGSPIDRIIVDLRRNGGGNSAPGTWFAGALSGIESINRPGGIYVLIGPRTFSSAMMLAADLMEKTEALFAGEPLAERVDSWGEVKRFALPASGLVVGHSTRFFTYSRGKKLRTVDGIIVPGTGLERGLTYAEWEAGADPLLDLVMKAGR